MTHPLLIGGVLLSPIVGACVTALIATCALSLLLIRIGFYRLVWHRPLVEVAIFCMFVALAGMLPVIGSSR